VGHPHIYGCFVFILVLIGSWTRGGAVLGSLTSQAPPGPAGGPRRVPLSAEVGIVKFDRLIIDPVRFLVLPVVRPNTEDGGRCKKSDSEIPVSRFGRKTGVVLVVPSDPIIIGPILRLQVHCGHHWSSGPHKESAFPGSAVNGNRGPDSAGRRFPGLGASAFS
jgi:hypothetical protein